MLAVTLCTLIKVMLHNFKLIISKKVKEVLSTCIRENVQLNDINVSFTILIISYTNVSSMVVSSIIVVSSTPIWSPVVYVK